MGVNRARLLGSLCLAAAVVSGCASSTPFTPDNPYPSRAEVRSIEERAAPEEIEVQSYGVVVERWALEGPFPSQIGRTPRNPVGAFELLTASSAKGAGYTEQMSCVARELARFTAKNGEGPASHIKEFVLNRCGALGVDVATRSMSWKVGRDQAFDEAAYIERDKGDLAQWAAELATIRDHVDVGAALVRGDDKVYAFMVATPRALTLEPLGMVSPGGGELMIRGELHDPAHSIFGFVTKGDYDADTCAVNSSVSLPRFEISCPIEPNDAMARFELSVRRKASDLFASRVFSQIVWTKAPSDEYVSPQLRQVIATLGVDANVGDDGFESSFVEMVNALRRDHDLPAFVHSSAQTSSLSKMTPHLIDAMSGDSERANEIFLGAMAGWDVSEGNVIDGNVHVQVQVTTRGKQMLAEMVDSPMGRRTLFLDEGGAMSIGSIAKDGRSASIVATYAFLPNESHMERLKEVQRTINRARKLAGNPKMKRYKNFYGLSDALAASVEGGEITPADATQRLGEEVSETLEDGVMMYTLLAESLDEFSVPAALVDPKKLNGAIMVAPYKPDGFPHTIYVITVVYPQSMHVE